MKDSTLLLLEELVKHSVVQTITWMIEQKTTGKKSYTSEEYEEKIENMKAAKWIFNPVEGMSDKLDFETCCDLLGYTPDTIRYTLRELLDKPATELKTFITKFKTKQTRKVEVQIKYVKKVRTTRKKYVQIFSICA